MKRSRCTKDSGLVAIEFVFVYLLVFLLLALSVPLVIALQERVRLERVAGHTARFATAAPDRPRFGSEKRRPTIGEVQAEGLRAYIAVGGPNPETNFSVEVDKDPRTVPPQEQITITIRKTVNLGAIGALMDIIGVTVSPNIDMTVTAVGRQE